MNRVTYEFFINSKILPKDFKYPSSYIDLVNKELPDIDPWGCFDYMLEHRYKWINKRYPDRTLVPFTRRYDNDDVACFDGTDTSGDPRVIIIHDWASPGWENRGEFENFLEWLDFAKEQAEEWKMFGGS